MSKKVVLIAGVVLAAGSVAAISSPYLRGGQLRLGQMFAEFGDDDAASRPGRSGKRHRQMDADRDGSSATRSGKRFDEGDDEKEGFTKARRERSAVRDLDDEDGSQDLRGRIGRLFGSWAHNRERNEEADETDKGVGKPGRDDDGSRRASSERQPGRADRQFSRLDRNGDGVIDAKDFEARAAELAANATRRFLKRFDTNGDGKVSREEFDRVLQDRSKERVADLELDGEDKITEAEPPRQPRRGIVK
jgi:hypothetical protein